jgi:hypothetical protein
MEVEMEVEMDEHVFKKPLFKALTQFLSFSYHILTSTQVQLQREERCLRKEVRDPLAR